MSVGRVCCKLMKQRISQTVLTEARCLDSIGQLVETAVSRVADDIIAIPDITADESERLKQICEVLKHVEDIFSGHVRRRADCVR